MRRKLTAEQKILEWLDDPETLEGAWKQYTYEHIADLIGLSTSTVATKLCKVVAAKYGGTIEQHINTRKAYAIILNHSGKRITQTTWNKVEDDYFNRKLSIYQIARNHSISYRIVRKHIEEITKRNE